MIQQNTKMLSKPTRIKPYNYSTDISNTCKISPKQWPLNWKLNNNSNVWNLKTWVPNLKSNQPDLCTMTYHNKSDIIENNVKMNNKKYKH